MAEIKFPAAAGTQGVDFYASGSKASSRVVGSYTSDGERVNRIARYTFQAPPEGAMGVSLLFNTGGLESGSVVPIRFYIGTDPDSHINAWDSSPYTGELSFNQNDNTFTGEAKILLLPNTVYYLFVFPATKTFGYYTWYKYGEPVGLILTTKESAGVVYVGNKDGEKEMYQFYILINSVKYLLLPYVAETTTGGGEEALGNLISADGYVLRDSNGLYLYCTEEESIGNLVSADGYILVDSNGLYLIAKEIS